MCQLIAASCPVEWGPATAAVTGERSHSLQGIGAVIHLAADSSTRASWESVHQHNIAGTHNVFAAARQGGVRKVVFATTNPVMGRYDRDRRWPVYSDQPVRPDALYDVSKALAPGRYAADGYGLAN